MRKIGLLIILCSVMFFPFLVHAQDTVQLTSVKVDIWPEYDQAAVLVIEHMVLGPDTSLPVTISVRIPSGSQINAIALVDSSGQLVNAPYESSIEGGWTILSITVKSLNLQVEYYQSLNKDGNNRHITYQWPGDNPVDNLEVSFLAPPNSTGIILDPQAQSSAPGQDGLTNYILPAQKLSAGQVFKVNIDYSRSTNELSIASQPVQAVTEPGTNTPGRVSMTVTWAWVLGGIGVLLVVGGVFGFINWKRSTQVSNTRSRARHPAVNVPADVIYCHECGKRANPGDIFCRTCGARLKQSE